MSRRPLTRPPGRLQYRTLFVIAAEGAITEPMYFAAFNDDNTTITVKCSTGRGGSSPPQVLKLMQSFLKDTKLRKNDEAWLVVDRDNWTDKQLQEAHSWTQNSKAYGFALTNPKFEYWLLLHFEDGDDVSSIRNCDERLRRYIPGYEKRIEVRKFTAEMILSAIDRAIKRNSPPCSDWPRSFGSTTVHILVQHILRSKTNSA